MQQRYGSNHPLLFLPVQGQIVLHSVFFFRRMMCVVYHWKGLRTGFRCYSQKKSLNFESFVANSRQASHHLKALVD